MEHPEDIGREHSVEEQAGRQETASGTGYDRGRCGLAHPEKLEPGESSEREGREDSSGRSPDSGRTSGTGDAFRNDTGELADSEGNSVEGRGLRSWEGEPRGSSRGVGESEVGDPAGVRHLRDGEIEGTSGQDSDGEGCRLHESSGAGALSRDESFPEGSEGDCGQGLDDPEGGSMRDDGEDNGAPDREVDPPSGAGSCRRAEGSGGLADSEGSRVEGYGAERFEESEETVGTEVSYRNGYGTRVARPGQSQYEWEPPRTVVPNSYSDFGNALERCIRQLFLIQTELQGRKTTFLPSEPSICRTAYGHTNFVDELRMCGNGVVPAVAGAAFVVLAKRLAESRDKIDDRDRKNKESWS